MEKRQLGRTGMTVTVLGFGGAEIGYQNAAQATVDRLLGAALDAGLNVIDTAECYVDSESLIGNAVAHRRQEFFLFTKCGHDRGSGLGAGDWDPPLMARTIDRSLKRLKTDCLDLVQLHSCSEEHLRQGEVIEVLERARQDGKTRFIGYSGDGAAARYAIECGRFDTLQTSVSIADQECLTLTLPLAKEKRMGVIAKRPIANAAWRTGQPPESDYHRPYWDRLQKLAYPFLKGDLEASISTALRFTLAQGVTTAIVGTQNPARWAANAKLLEAGPLDPATIAAIRQRWQEVAGSDWTGQI
jgi:aryl-alcohol dehydrogenase-like predicted oxidoreductase